jgi:hypothetical protein
MKDLSPSKSLAVMNTLKEIGILPQSMMLSLTQRLIEGSETLTPQKLAVVLVILNSDEINQVYRSNDKLNILTKGFSTIEKSFIKN